MVCLCFRRTHGGAAPTEVVSRRTGVDVSDVRHEASVMIWEPRAGRFTALKILNHRGHGGTPERTNPGSLGARIFLSAQLPNLENELRPQLQNAGVVGRTD